MSRKERIENRRLQQSRRSFLLRTGVLAGGLALGTFFLKEYSDSKSTYSAYQQHVKNRRAKVKDVIFPYSKVSKDDFYSLEKTLHGRLVSVGRTPPPSFYLYRDENLARIFTRVYEDIAAEEMHQVRAGNHTIFFHYNPVDVSMSLSETSVSAYIEWADKLAAIKPHAYSGAINQYVLAASFAENPMAPGMLNSSSATLEGNNNRNVFTLLNLSAPHEYGLPDEALATELMQARLTQGGINQEILANSLSLAYKYAVE